MPCKIHILIPRHTNPAMDDPFAGATTASRSLATTPQRPWEIAAKYRTISLNYLSDVVARTLPKTSGDCMKQETLFKTHTVPAKEKAKHYIMIFR